MFDKPESVENHPAENHGEKVYPVTFETETTSSINGNPCYKVREPRFEKYGIFKGGAPTRQGAELHSALYPFVCDWRSDHIVCEAIDLIFLERALRKFPPEPIPEAEEE